MRSSCGAGPTPRRGGFVLALVVVLACSKSPVGPGLPALEVISAGGDGQYGTAGVELPEPLRIVVRAAESKLPVEDVDVRWEVVSGDATLLGPDVRVTDDTGAAEISLRLGSSRGEITIAATVAGQSEATAVLHAFLVGKPVVTSVEPTEIEAGESVSLEGENFSPVPDQNVVLFSGIRGRVTSATATRLVVDVPDCLAPRDSVSVRTSLGMVSSDSIEVSVVSGGPVLAMSVGQGVVLDDPRALDCIRLSGEGGAAFMAMPYSSSTVAAALHPFQLTGLAHTAVLTAPGRQGKRSFRALSESDGGPPGSGPTSAQERFESRIRLEEGVLIEQRQREHLLLREIPSPVAAPPVVGQTRNFFVYNGQTDPSTRFDEITATVRYVGTHVAIYVDNDAPEPGFTNADLEALAARFDQVIRPTVTDAFGQPSDLDGTGRIAVLFTPVVNGLTPRESTSFVGGFFFGRDLMPELSSSNAAEVFYALVPDSAAIYSDRRDREQVLKVVPGILAHEFQHMVHYNQRVLLRDGSQDALWMLEGLAQMAEELVARAYEEGAAALDAELFRDGNRRRARLFLERPDTVSLIVSSGRGTLGERGAGFLFLMYLHQQHGDDLLGRLTRSTRTGVANVEAEVGAEWSTLLSDWATAMFLDGSTAASDRFSYPGFDLWGFLEDPPPFGVQLRGGSDFERSGSLPSASLQYFILRPPEGGSLSIAIGGAGGGSHRSGAAFGLRIVRIE